MLVEDQGVLDTSVDIGGALALCDVNTAQDARKRGRAVEDDDDDEKGVERRRRTSKHAPKKQKGSQGKGCSKAKAKPGKKVKEEYEDDDDGGGEDKSPAEEGEDDSEGHGKKGCEKKGCEKKGDDKKCDDKKGCEKKAPRRDQCKRRKFFSIWDKLPEDVQNHFDHLDRGEQTTFINGCY